MKRRIFLLTLVLMAATESYAAESNPFEFIDDEAASATRVVVAGVTLGNNWAGFQTKFAAGYTGSPLDDVDVTLPLYVTWLSDSDDFFGSPIQVTPTPVVSYDWFQEGGGSTWRVEEISMAGVEYKQCPDGQGLELPTLYSHPTELHFNGELRVKDTHGGIAVNTLIRMSRYFSIGGNPTAGRAHLIVNWNRPGTYFDDYLPESNPVYAIPGTVYNRRIIRRVGGVETIRSYVHVRIIEWVSSDLAVPNSPGPSPRFVDAADLSYWHSFCEPLVGQLARWGFSTENPPNSPTYHCNVGLPPISRTHG